MPSEGDPVTTAIGTGRDARGALAEVADVLQRAEQWEKEQVNPIRHELAQAIGALYQLESEDGVSGRPDAERARRVHDALQTTMEHLQTVLQRMQELEAPPQTIETATERVARTLATLYPTRNELARSVQPAAESEPAEEPAIPLQPKRKKPAKPALEVVPEEEAPAAPSAPAPEPDRRAGPRIDLDVGIGYQSDTNFYTGFSGDISEGGLFVATYDLLPIGTELVISFLIPDGPQITTRGRVAWVREPVELDADVHPGMGVEFLDLSNDDREAIMRFIRKREPIFHAD